MQKAMDPIMRHTAHMKNLVFPLPVGQNRKMNQAGGDSHRIHLPHQGADPFFIPKDIGEIGELAPYIMVRDAQVVPIFMPSGEDVEVSPPPKEAYEDSMQRYGAVKICRTLNGSGTPCSIKRVQRHMAKQGLR